MDNLPVVSLVSAAAAAVAVPPSLVQAARATTVAPCTEDVALFVVALTADGGIAKNQLKMVLGTFVQTSHGRPDATDMHMGPMKPASKEVAAAMLAAGVEEGDIIAAKVPKTTDGSAFKPVYSPKEAHTLVFTFEKLLKKGYFKVNHSSMSTYITETWSTTEGDPKLLGIICRVHNTVSFKLVELLGNDTYKRRNVIMVL